MEVGKKERKIGNEILLAGGESNNERLGVHTTTKERENDRRQRGWRRSP
jgi:hypothetical protein